MRSIKYNSWGLFLIASKSKIVSFGNNDNHTSFSPVHRVLSSRSVMFADLYLHPAFKMFLTAKCKASVGVLGNFWWNRFKSSVNTSTLNGGIPTGLIFFTNCKSKWENIKTLNDLFIHFNFCWKCVSRIIFNSSNFILTICHSYLSFNFIVKHQIFFFNFM